MKAWRVYWLHDSFNMAQRNSFVLLAHLLSSFQKTLLSFFLEIGGLVDNLLITWVMLHHLFIICS